MTVAELVELLMETPSDVEVRIESLTGGDHSVLRMDDVADEAGRVTTVWLVGNPNA